MSKAQKVIDQICFGEDCEAFKAFRKVQDRAKREHANLNAAGAMVKQSAEALEEAKNSYYGDNSSEMFKKLVKAHRDHHALQAAFEYASLGNGAVRENFCNCPSTIEALENALKTARDRLGKRIAALNEAHAKQLAEDGLEVTESPSLNPLKDYHGKLAAAISTIADKRRESQSMNSLWTQFSHLIHLS